MRFGLVCDVSGRAKVSLAGDVAAGRELAVLADGPWAPRWYWRADLEAMQRAGGRYPDGHPAAELRRYQPTGRFRTHPEDGDADGREWTYRVPQPVPEPARDADDYGDGDSS